MPSVEIYNVLKGFVAGIVSLFTTILLKEGMPPRLDGTAQNVPPSPSDVSVVSAGIIPFFGVRTFI